MFYCVLTGFITLLISGKAWISFSTMAVAGLIFLAFSNRNEVILSKNGGVKSARVLGRTCYRNGRDLPSPRDTEYTVLIQYRNGDTVRYTLNGNQSLLKALRPYFGRA